MSLNTPPNVFVPSPAVTPATKQAQILVEAIHTTTDATIERMDRDFENIEHLGQSLIARLDRLIVAADLMAGRLGWILFFVVLPFFLVLVPGFLLLMIAFLSVLGHAGR